MRLATVANGTPDGQLVVISDGGQRCIPVTQIAPTLQAALERWDEAAPLLRSVAQWLQDDSSSGWAVSEVAFAAPLPRAWQWLDGSAFATHGDLMQVAFGLDPIDTERPLMYQGMSDQFLGPNDHVRFPDENLGIDFEGEFGVIVDAVPMGITVEQAAEHIRLIVQINDWSLRTLAPIEMKTGFGWVQAKPACSMAPYAVTPDELSDGWADGRVSLDLEIDWNGERFGRVNGNEMAFSFPELVAHAARTRALVAGTIIGSGTVSNAEYATKGSACISERRAIEMIELGAPKTGFMRFGDRVRMEAKAPSGAPIFGIIDQLVCRA